MQPIKGRILTLVISALGLTLNGCGSGDPEFSILPETDFFVSEVNNKLDILFVMDNSGSMSENQNNLATNFSAFISNFSTLGYDYQLAVTATDAWRSKYVSTQPLKNNLVKFRDGTDATGHTGVFVITPATLFPPAYPTLNATFAQNIKLGVNGSGDERPLESFVDALESPLNAGFIRPGAHLAVIIISDEEDYSWAGSGCKQCASPPDSTNLTPVSNFYDKLVSYKGTQADVFSVSAIIIEPGDTACMTQNGFGKYGTRIKQLSDMTNGTTGSICDPNFSATLNEMQQNIGTLSTQYFLTRIPIVETIVVTMNGVVVPKDPVNGWQYDATNNSIKFYGTAQPPQGAQISVDFDPTTI